MKFTDLQFEDHPMFKDFSGISACLPDAAQDFWHDQWLRQARVTFPNGMTASIVYGLAAFADWQPGLYELMTVDPFGEVFQEFQVRGDEKIMQETLDRIEQWQTEVTI